MTWFKIDDSFYDHLKVFDAPDCAVALWVRAGAWAARNLTDGFVPSGMPARLCDDAETAVRELVRRKLWLRVKDGFRFHDWTKYQPTRESVEQDREAATERKRRERERRRSEKVQVSQGGVTDESHRDTTGTTGVTHGPVTAPRPDPTRPEVPTELKTLPAVAGDGQQTLAGMPEPLVPPIQANDVVAAFVDRCSLLGQDKPTDGIIKRIARDAKKLIEIEKVAGQKLVAAAEFIAEKGWQSLESGLRHLAANNNESPKPGNGAGYQSTKHKPFMNPPNENAYEGVL